MAEVKTLLNELSEIALHPARSTQALIEDGKELIGCFPIFMPEEIIYAAGYIPIGMWGGDTSIKKADSYLQGFCCSIMRANLEFALNDVYKNLNAVIIPAYCDTLKCMIENWKAAMPSIPVFPIVHAQNRYIPDAQRYMETELHRILSQLDKLSGRETSDQAVEDALEIYEQYREQLRRFTKLAPKHSDVINSKTRHLIFKASYFMDKKDYAEKLSALNDALEKLPEKEFDGVKAVTTGLIVEPLNLLDEIDESGILIVGDDIAHESGQVKTMTRTEGDAFYKIAGRTLDHDGSAFIFDRDKTRGEYILELKDEYDADLVVTVMMKFCDPEEFDYPVYKEELSRAEVPHLYLETEYGGDAAAQNRTRIQSMVEMLS